MKKLFILFLLTFSLSNAEWSKITETPVGKTNLTIFNNTQLGTSATSYSSLDIDVLEKLYQEEATNLNNQFEFKGFVVGKQKYRNKFVALKKENNAFLEISGLTKEDIEKGIDEWITFKTLSTDKKTVEKTKETDKKDTL